MAQARTAKRKPSGLRKRRTLGRPTATSPELRPRLLDAAIACYTRTGRPVRLRDHLNPRGLAAGIADKANTAGSRAAVMDMLATGVVAPVAETRKPQELVDLLRRGEISVGTPFRPTSSGARPTAAKRCGSWSTAATRRRKAPPRNSRGGFPN